MKPIYKELTFKTHSEFNEWLTETTYKTITLKDNGQDLQKIHVAKNGEIIHCDLQADIWNGTFIDFNMLEPGKNLVMHNKHLKGWREMDFVIEEIINS